MTRITVMALICVVALTHAAAAQDPFAGFKTNAEIRAEQEAARKAAEASGKPLEKPSEPVVRADLSARDVVPGQSLNLDLTILVPTYMPRPPEITTIDQPNLMIRTPKGGSGPVTEPVGGENWSGIRKRYEITPLVPGSFQLPPIDVTLTWADPDTNAPIQTRIELDTQRFAASLPAGAEGLDPFIAAQALTLTQTVEGNDQALAPGDTLVREVTAEITGASGLMLPEILVLPASPGLAAYPDTPGLTTQDKSGMPNGIRTERVVYVAQGGAEGSLPGVELSWYNLESGAVETVSVPGISYKVTGPVLPQLRTWDWRVWAIAAVAGLLVLLLMTRLAGYRARSRAGTEPPRPTEATRYKDLMKTVKSRDISNIYADIDKWARLFDGPDPRARADVRAALGRIGAASFGRVTTSDSTAWPDLAKALSEARRRATVADQTANLPPLNPSGAT